MMRIVIPSSLRIHICMLKQIHESHFGIVKCCTGPPWTQPLMRRSGMVLNAPRTWSTCTNIDSWDPLGWSWLWFVWLWAEKVPYDSGLPFQIFRYNWQQHQQLSVKWKLPLVTTGFQWNYALTTGLHLTHKRSIYFVINIKYNRPHKSVFSKFQRRSMISSTDSQ